MAVRVRVFDTAIDSYFWAGRPVFNEANKLARRINAAAIAGAPERTGELKASHRAGNALYSGRFRVRADVTNFAPHALWVHEGVPGRIYPKNGKKLKIAYGPHFTPSPAAALRGKTHLYTDSVRGQDANPWILRAAREVLATY